MPTPPSTTDLKPLEIFGEDVERVKQYLSDKERWKKERPEPIGPQTANYETYQGYRGIGVKKTMERIHRGFGTDEEDAFIDEKTLGDEAFRAGDHDLAAEKYYQAIAWGMPHNAVCWSNRAAALLKSEKWKEALSSGHAALKEHASVHGYHYGVFHIKVLHRIGLAHMGLGNFEQAKEYFDKALKINPRNEAVRGELAKAEAKIKDFRQKFGDDRESEFKERYELYGGDGRWDILPVDFELFVKVGVPPWDEHARDLIYVAVDVPVTKMASLPEQSEIESFHKDILGAPGCFECKTCKGWFRGKCGVLAACKGCAAQAYCSELCEVQEWSTHAPMCAETSKGLKLLPNQRNDAFVVQRVQSIVAKNADRVNMGGMYALNIIEDHSAFERYAAVIDFEYQPEPALPLRALDIRRVPMEELERRYPKSLSTLRQNWGQANAREKSMGFLGAAVVISLVLDGSWEFAQCQLLTLSKNFMDSAPPSNPAGWKERMLEDLVSEGRP